LGDWVMQYACNDTARAPRRDPDPEPRADFHWVSRHFNAYFTFGYKSTPPSKQHTPTAMFTLICPYTQLNCVSLGKNAR